MQHIWSVVDTLGHDNVQRVPSRLGVVSNRLRVVGLDETPELCEVDGADKSKIQMRRDVSVDNVDQPPLVARAWDISVAGTNTGASSNTVEIYP